ncbi:MAG: hypothetical protein WA741_34490 [Candidatus Sulfotelmatobacter sp.]
MSVIAPHYGKPADIVLYHNLMSVGSDNTEAAGENILAIVDKAMATVAKDGGQ